VKFESDRKANAVPDLSLWNMSCLVSSKKAKDALFPLLGDLGEFLPLQNDFFLFNCLISVGGDAVDQSKTKLDLESQDSVHVPNTLEFLPEKIKGKALFKPGFAHNSFLICQGEFKTVADANGLTGVVFTENLAQIFPPKS
jgi:hypothetical protein